MVIEPSERAKPYIDIAWDTAKKALKKNGHVDLLVVFVEMKTGQLTFMPSFATPQDKRLLDVAIYMASENIPCDLVVVLSEAWALSTKLDPNEIRRLDRTGLRDHPNRVEIINVTWKTRYGEEGTASRLLMRDKGEDKPYVGKPWAIPSANPAEMSSTMRFLHHVFKGTPPGDDRAPLVPEGPVH